MLVGEFLLAQPIEAPWNCSTEPGNWVVALGHPDFVAPWRDIVGEADVDSLLDLWREGIGSGLPPAAEPYLTGDIGVVEAHGLQSGAICTGDKWAIRTKRGHIFTSQVAVLQAWRP